MIKRNLLKISIVLLSLFCSDMAKATDGVLENDDFKLSLFGPKDSLLIGKWLVVDYSDNLRRSPVDSSMFFKYTLPEFKENAVLIFYADYTFERKGFTTEVETGGWTLNHNGTILYLELEDNNTTDKVMIEGLSENSFTVVVEEEFEDSDIVTTKITFSKKQ